MITSLDSGRDFLFHRKHVLKAAGGNCFHCEVRDACVMDHIVSKSRGGTDARWNLKAACQKCAKEKNNNMVVAFRNEYQHRHRCVMVLNSLSGSEKDCANTAVVR